MKVTTLRAAFCGVAIALAGPALASDADVEALKAEAAGLMKSFGDTLRGELVAAIEAGGPVKAISVCNEAAPAIAESVSADSGWSVGRSSHRLRNPDNAPDAFTAAAIDDFLAREAAGEAVDSLATAAVVEEDGKRVFHIVKAIPTGEPCVACHGGDNVKDEVVAALAEMYPEDTARGFSPGQMRGVFTLSKVLD
ncbi:DUF3365 domain-containing protein [Maritimibacter sp. HL-12]|jgi:hypothetical protein|uniref:Tll0287-like domain-containing protein n=1 Tax=Maritimibacter sp. HL-12 TaxID=1162418 RepID=UPI000A0EEF28|nr:DUF3365 domain-containing protein [Maritimibacter sp. HL-12]SMH29854.1 Protein of unknown function [Maritimibacter sp. HL-12]